MKRPALEKQPSVVLWSRVLLFVVTGFLWVGCSVVPQTTSRSVLTPDEFAEDLALIEKTLDTVHIGPWQSPDHRAAFLSNLQNLKRRQLWLSRPLDLYRNVAPMIASLNEAHTFLDIGESELPASMRRMEDFPLALAIEKNRTLVVADLTGQGFVPVGAELVAINKIPMARIRASLLPYVSAETPSGKRRLLQLRFGHLLTTAMGIEAPFQITWRLGFGLKTVSMDAAPRHAQQTIEPIVDAEPWSSWRLDDGSVVLGMHHFDTDRESFRRFCETFFANLAENPPPRMVLDLRYNPGGLSDNVMILLAHLTDEPLSWADRIEIRNSEPFRAWFSTMAERKREEALGRYLRWVPLEYLEDWPWKMLLTRDGQVTELKLGPWSSTEHEAKPYLGPLAVLVNGYCFSGCAYLVDALQASGRAVVVGESPGSLAGLQLGLPVRVTLPHSRLVLQVPAARLVKKNERHIIVPDVEVERTGEDLANQRDPELAAALDVLTSLSR